MKRILAVALLTSCVVAATVSAIPGNTFGIQIGAGMAGSVSYFEVGVKLSKINDKVFIDIKARLASSFRAKSRSRDLDFRWLL